MYNIVSKHDHLLSKENFMKNVPLCTIMYQNRIIYETQKTVFPCTIMY